MPPTTQAREVEVSLPSFQWRTKAMRRRRSAIVWHLWLVSVALVSAVAFSPAESSLQTTVLTLSPESAVTLTGGQLRGVLSHEHPDKISLKHRPSPTPPIRHLR